MAETPNIWTAPPIGQNWGDQWERLFDDFWLAVTGEPGYGKQWKLTQWDGPDYHLDLTSQDTVSGKAGRTLSQNNLFGWRVNNAEFGVTGAPTLDAFTQGSVLFVGASKVLSQDNANLFYDDAADTLKAKNLIVPTKAAIGASSLGAEVLTVTGNGRFSTFLGVGGAPDATHALLVTGLGEITSRLGVGGAAHATETLRVTGTMSSSDKAAVKGLTGTEDFVVNGTQQVTTRLGVGGAPDGTAAFKVTGDEIITGNITNDTSTFVTDATNNRVGILTASPQVSLDVAGTARITNAVTPVGGEGLEISYITGATPAGQLVCYSRASAVFRNFQIQGLQIDLAPSGTSKFLMDGTGIRYFAGGAGVAKQTVTGVRTGTLAQLQTVVANMLTALANYSLWTDSTT